MTQRPRTPTTDLTVAEKDEIARMALDEDTAVSLVEWIERDRADLLAQIEKAVREDAEMYYGKWQAGMLHALAVAIRSAAPVEPSE